jgi:hypothetical protein
MEERWREDEGNIEERWGEYIEKREREEKEKIEGIERRWSKDEGKVERRGRRRGSEYGGKMKE